MALLQSVQDGAVPPQTVPEDLLPTDWATGAGLGAAEQALVLLAAGPTLDGRIGPLCGALRGRPDQPWPTLSLAMRCIPGLSWAHVHSNAPARWTGLVELGPGEDPMHAPLRTPERVWAALAGQRVADPILTTVAAISMPAVDEPGVVAEARASITQTTVLVLHGAPRERLAGVARTIASTLGRSALRIRADLLPADISAVVKASRREGVLEDATLVLDLLDADAPARHRALQVLRGLPGVVMVLDHQPIGPGERPFVPLHVPPVAVQARVAAWHTALSALGYPSPQAQETAAWSLGGTFLLSPQAMRTAVVQAAAADTPQKAIWRTAAAQVQRPPGGLVSASRPDVSPDALLVSDRNRAALDELVDAVRDRTRVLDAWGMAGSGQRGRGLTALFAGPSGTGKTLAAEVVASTLGLALWRIDLSTVVSKYIGETEKNLGAVFDAADGAGAVLLFDEADALFARRGDVQDARDRYANLEVGFLLQRIEAFHGLAILTSNMADQIDPAFQRRMRTVVRFGFPGAAERAALWGRAFPPAVPTQDLVPERLAQLQLTGAEIRAVATHAAFLAIAESHRLDSAPMVTMALLARSVRTRMAQLGRVMSERELEGW